MRTSVLPLTASKRIPLTILAALLVGMGALFGLGVRTAETKASPVNRPYEVRDLGTLGHTSSFALGINDSGEVVGYSSHSQHPTDYYPHRAFLYDEGATPEMKDLGSLGGYYSHATDINDAGEVVGWSSTKGEGSYRAFLYKDGRMIDLNTLISEESAGLSMRPGPSTVGDR